MKLYYAGVGSRQAPGEILLLMTRVATTLEKKSYWLRSGGATGADTAFSKGCEKKKEIFVPWDGFNDIKMQYPIPELAYSISADLHPAWEKLSAGMQAMMARNVMQVMGKTLNEPAQFVVCWTPDGVIRAEDTTSKTGGTGHAIRVAGFFGIPVFNLQLPEHHERFRRMVYG